MHALRRRLKDGNRYNHTRAEHDCARTTDRCEVAEAAIQRELPCLVGEKSPELELVPAGVASAKLG